MTDINAEAASSTDGARRHKLSDIWMDPFPSRLFCPHGVGRKRNERGGMSVLREKRGTRGCWKDPLLVAIRA